MVIKFKPTEIDNIPKFLNENIEKNENEKYIMFIFDDIYQDLKDPDDFYKKYEDLLIKYDLPYAFYPYYVHFNKILRSSLSYPATKMRVSIANEPAFDVVNQTSYGMLIINVEKLKQINFKFDEKFETAFYVQNLIEECYKNNLWFSSSWFIDVYKSYELVNSNFKIGFLINPTKFTEEKTKFYSIYKQQQNDTAQSFIEHLNAKCKFLKEQWGK